jgi:molybdopterin synthase sulfur carrier subunit
MSVKVLIPTPLRNLTGNAADVQVDAKDIASMLQGLEAKHPGIKERLCDDSGKLRRFVNVYLNEEDIRFMQAEATALKDGDEVSIVPAIAGGHA